MSKDSDLYGDDIRLWSETQSALLRKLSAGEAVADQVDWPHVVEEIEHSHAQPPEHQDEIARLTARLTAAEALVSELRARLDDLTGKLADKQTELVAAQDEAETATARAAAAVEAEQAIRQAPMTSGGRGVDGRGSGQRGGARRAVRDAQLAPGHPCGRRCHCPGHVGLQHTRLDRDEIADDRRLAATAAGRPASRKHQNNLTDQPPPGSATQG